MNHSCDISLYLPDNQDEHMYILYDIHLKERRYILHIHYQFQLFFFCKKNAATLNLTYLFIYLIKKERLGTTKFQKLVDITEVCLDFLYPSVIM